MLLVPKFFSFSLTGRLCSGGKRFDWSNAIFATYFTLKKKNIKKLLASTLDMVPSTLDPRHKDRLVSVEQYFTFFDRFTSNFRSMVVIKPCTGVKTGINGVNRNSVTSSCWLFFFFFWNSISPNCWAGEKSYLNRFVLIKKIYPHFASLMRWHIRFTELKCRQNFM